LFFSSCSFISYFPLSYAESSLSLSSGWPSFFPALFRVYKQNLAGVFCVFCVLVSLFSAIFHYFQLLTACFILPHFPERENHYFFGRLVLSSVNFVFIQAHVISSVLSDFSSVFS